MEELVALKKTDSSLLVATCTPPFRLLLILCPLRHCGAAHQADILGAASGAEVADVEQMKKNIPFVTCEITCSQNVCELMFGVNVPDLKLGINNQSKATLWVLETCLIVGLRPLMIILITASLSSNTYNTAS